MVIKPPRETGERAEKVLDDAVTVLQEHGKNITLRQAGRIVMSLRVALLLSVAGLLVALAGGAYRLGRSQAPPTKSAAEQPSTTLTGEFSELKRTLEFEVRDRKVAEEDRDKWRTAYLSLEKSDQKRAATEPAKLPPTSPPRTYRVPSFPAYITRPMIRDFQAENGSDPTPNLKPVVITDAPSEFTQGVLAMHPPISGQALAEFSIPVGAELFRADAALKGPCSGQDWGSVNVWIQIDNSPASEKRELRKGSARTTYDILLPKDARRLTLFADPLDNGHWCDQLFWLEARFLN